jgi:hypothetical protein
MTLDRAGATDRCHYQARVWSTVVNPSTALATVLVDELVQRQGVLGGLINEYNQAA